MPASFRVQTRRADRRRITVRRTTKAAFTLAATMTMAAALATAAAGPASANYLKPITLLCSAAANGGTLEGSLCVLPFGVTTAPNTYSAAIAVSNPGTADNFALTAGSLPPGLTMSPSGPGAVITGNPTQTGTFNFTIKLSSPQRLPGTRAYQITITVPGPPDHLVCDPAVNGGFLINGVCVLPDAVIGQPYQGHLVTSHQAGGMLNVIAGSLPPGLSMPATFGPSGDTGSGTPTDPGVQHGRNFTVQGTGDKGQPLYQAYTILGAQNGAL